MNRKQILVTGASRGIGKACAIHFAKEGWHVFLNCGKSISELQATADFITKETSGSCEILPGDVGVPSEVGRIFDQIEMSGSGLDVLINNAGIAWMGLLTDMSIEEWNRMISTNLSSAFYCCRAALPYMIHQKAGRIINISSMWGTVGASCEVAYSATKSGLNGLTRALAKELAPSNIQVNAIACGVIDTVMNDLLDAEEKGASQKKSLPDVSGHQKKSRFSHGDLQMPLPILPGRYWVWTEDISNSYSQILSHFA